MMALTKEEQELVEQAGIIYLKNSALQKVMVLLGELQELLQALPESAPFREQNGKISRGERYKELPYIILDYPRSFSRESIFACRTMFWWGHYFIFTLHLAGEAKERYGPAIGAAWAVLGAQGFRIYEGEDPWEHDFETGNYLPVSAMAEQEFRQLLNSFPFIKLAKPYQLDNWENMLSGVVADYQLLLQLMAGH
jgi:hypothetical protein